MTVEQRNSSIRGNRARIFLVSLEEGRPAWVSLIHREFRRDLHSHWECPLGGHINTGENPHQAAVRELAEETGLTGVDLVDFAECEIEGIRKDYFFRGFHQKDESLRSDEGPLWWVPAGSLLDQKLEPVTRLVTRRWVGQNFDVDPYWTVRARTLGRINCVLQVQFINDQRSRGRRRA